jgi:hypothetical protein
LFNVGIAMKSKVSEALLVTGNFRQPDASLRNCVVPVMRSSSHNRKPNSVGNRRLHACLIGADTIFARAKGRAGFEDAHPEMVQQQDLADFVGLKL